MKSVVIFMGYLLIGFIFLILVLSIFSVAKNFSYSEDFNLLSNPDNKEFMDNLVSYAKSNGVKLKVEYADDLEILDYLEEQNEYDGVWMSNSIWLYMLEKAKVTNSKSISINPVVMGIKKSKAESLNLTNGNIYNKDIMNTIKSGKLKYIMTSVTKTNTGLTAYLGFLNSLAGSPEILSSEMLKNNTLISDLKSLFSGVERVSGNDTFLEDMFLKSNSYEAVIATESSLININKKLVSEGKEPLYLIYPVDGVAINDSPFAYVDRSQEKLESFNKLQSYLLSKSAQDKMQESGKRTWYGGISKNVNKTVFNPEWGIDTDRYLIPLKYPSKSVMNEAILLYIDELRKPSHIVFCLDYSGSMFGEGNEQLVSAMEFILDYEDASIERLQFSKRDKITVIPFDNKNRDVISTDNGRNTTNLISKIKSLKPGGTTNIYDCSIEGLRLLKFTSDEYTKTVVLMTDGESNAGSYYNLSSYYYNNSLTIPIYSIMFGTSSETQLDSIAELTNAKVFDGRSSLIKAFKEVRSYN